MLKKAMRHAIQSGIDPDLLRREAAIPRDLFEELCDVIDVANQALDSAPPVLNPKHSRSGRRDR